MEESKEISALFQLIDDPDQEVFDAVSKKIVDYGKPIIPNLEHLWETTPSEETQTRIELLIHRLHYRDLTEDFHQWSISGHHDLMVGGLLVCKFLYPELSTTPVLQEIEKVRRNIWLELNNYLTPLEQINIVTSILYSYYGLKGGETSYTEPNEFLLGQLGPPNIAPCQANSTQTKFARLTPGQELALFIENACGVTRQGVTNGDRVFWMAISVRRDNCRLGWPVRIHNATTGFPPAFHQVRGADLAAENQQMQRWNFTFHHGEQGWNA